MGTDFMSLYGTTIALVIVFLLLPLLFRRKPQAPKHRDTAVDPKYASTYYRAYLGETLRLAGFNPAEILRDKATLASGELLELIVKAEELLFLRIVKTLHNGKPELDYPFKDFGEYRAGQSYNKARELGASEHVIDLAMALLKKINPVLQQVAGDWVQGK
ncbi:MAG TPA: hypothetical protein VGO61_07265 [Steroidobacteraceae bacterium]|jgi:hypothetical protein|nr:hypothetical protein [Steroidobacteraceae bacterium]